ncbi:lipase family protein [Mycobacterium sp. SM3041]|uniref:lipase family protein n=1 Tax=Mycobacterium sp. SM3041 TaxID=3114291 RepID=UPI003204F00B
MIRTLATLSVAMVLLAGCSGTATDNASKPTADSADERPTAVPVTDVDPTLRDVAASIDTVTYVSRSGVNDGGTHVSAVVLVPKSTPPVDGFPIAALGHPVTGITPDCAPSQSPTLLGLAPTVATLLRAGYVVAVPDYQGLGKPAVTDDDYNHYYPYLDSTTAGYNMIDAARATHTMVPQSSTSWAALGVREGGQAAWAANELADGYGWGMKLVGVASISPISDVMGLADAAQAGTLSDGQKVVFARYLAAMHREYQYDVELDDFRRGTAQQQWDALMGCRSDKPEVIASTIAPADLKPSGPEALSTLRGYLRKTNLPQGPALAPMLVSYNTADQVPPFEWTDRALAAACKMADTITIQQRPDPQADLTTALAWINDRFKSVPATNDCAGRT